MGVMHGVMHLTYDALRRLLAGTLRRGDALALADHLDLDCEVCENLLASKAQADAADGLVDGALLALRPFAAGESGNDLEYARIQRALRAAGGRRSLRYIAAAAAVAAAVGVALWNEPGLRRDGWDGVKGFAPAGVARAVPAHLSVVHLTSDGGRWRTEKVAEGDSVPAHGFLAFQVEVGVAADVALACVGRDGKPDVFWASRVEPGRPVQPMTSGRPAGYPLEELSGAQRLVLLASTEPLPPERAAAAARALAPPARVDPQRPELDGISFQVVELSVRR